MTAKLTATTVDWDPATDVVSATILEAVADAKGVDPLEIDTPLYDVVDPDALDRLFGRRGGRTDRLDGQVTFHYEDCRITVEGAGTITVRPGDVVPDDRPDAPLAVGRVPASSNSP